MLKRIDMIDEKLDIIISRLDVIDNKNVKFARDIKVQLSFAQLLRSLTVSSGRLKRGSYRFSSFYLDNKETAYEFCDSIDIERPEVYKKNSSFNDVLRRLSYPAVLKPMSEALARGVYLIYSPTNIVYLNEDKQISSILELTTHVKSLLKIGRVKEDKWILEEMLVYNKGKARDIKFYMFHGKIGLVLETDRNYPFKRCWFDEDLNYVDCGKYSHNRYEAPPPPQELIEKAKYISEKIPTPFVRIDFLVGDNKIVVGEFTPTPSGYWEFNEQWDLKLGNLFQDACNRIVYKAHVGDCFEEYSAFLRKGLG